MSDLKAAIEALEQGLLVVMPTDTVYGIAARPDLPAGVGAIFEAKGRPTEKALPVLGHDYGALTAVARLDDRAAKLAERFWPGPLTVVVPRAEGFDHDLGGVQDGTVAVRVPASELARTLLAATGPLAVTSANLSGSSPAQTVDEAKAAFGDRVAVYLDDGPSGVEPSTVISLVGDPTILREGAAPSADVLGSLA